MPKMQPTPSRLHRRPPCDRSAKSSTASPFHASKKLGHPPQDSPPSPATGTPQPPYLTTRQGSRRFSAGIAHAATASVQDAKCTLLGIPFVGTDHVFRLNGTRVEAFSGVHADLFDHLIHSRLEQYRSDVHALRSTWPSDTWDEE